ncbi:dTDP-4-dehydrorhamnose 3,5-epimerase [Kordiimonas pumila]|uniref:dTDP-4-dehydrorhamnose 3,5-epimerase n=1 Tax=Kordiimonas pumila TaxID=2161677 RepID=A0ABV7D0F7_9PROT|nr:dTDP-4-dehydrorhamnose 3,5-epimerase [Kordiimonas pumila]
MGMKFEKLGGTDVCVISRNSFSDARGSFTRVYCEAEFAEAGLPTHFPHINFSDNVAPFTLRGMHFQYPPHEEGKMIFCVAGRIFDVAVDVRPESSTYKQWVGLELDADNKQSLYVPAGFAHGFLTLEPHTRVIYMATEPYKGGAEGGLRYDDPAIAIKWPAQPVTVSDKDLVWPCFDAAAHHAAKWGKQK